MNENSTGGSHPSTLHRRETSVPLHRGLQKRLGFKLRVPEESSKWAKYLKAGLFVCGPGCGSHNRLLGICVSSR